MATKNQSKSKLVDGNELLYRFFQALIDIDHELSIVVLKKLISMTAVWLPPETFEKIPILMPWVVRDNSCRKKVTKSVNQPEMWGAPDENGYLRDDNSLINKIPKSLQIVGPKSSPLKGKLIDTGWTASHIWLEIGTGINANRDPRLNSFVPNLVWLPKQIAKLSDIDGGVVQTALKATSWNLYRTTTFTNDLHPLVENIWQILPPPSSDFLSDFGTDELCFFEPTEKFYSYRKDVFHRYFSFIRDCAQEVPSEISNITKRYFNGLPNLSPSIVNQVADHIASHTSADYLPT
jgi:hypothetical protein